MAAYQVGAVINGCRIEAGPVPNGHGHLHWALTCTVCDRYFGVHEDDVSNGCPFCFRAYVVAETKRYRAVRFVRTRVGAKAREIVNKALRQGTLVAPTRCSRCNKADRRRVSAHHEAYARPLEVVWLCARCRIARHKEARLANFDFYTGTPGAFERAPLPASMPKHPASIGAS